MVDAGAAEWNSLSTAQRAPWQRLSDESARHYAQQKALQERREVRYCLTDAGLAAAARRKKKAIATAAAAKVKAKARSSAPSFKPKPRVSSAKTVRKSSTTSKVRMPPAAIRVSSCRGAVDEPPG